MDSRYQATETLRNKCAACFRQFNKLEHLVEHMRISHHSVHEPTCGVCKKHCRSFESLREHLIGPLPKQECRNIFSVLGCRFCMAILDTPHARRAHEGRCQLSNVNAVVINFNMPIARLLLERVYRNVVVCFADDSTISPVFILLSHLMLSPSIYKGLIGRMANLGIQDKLSNFENGRRGAQAVALACKMVGGGSDGSLDLCARVCIIDDCENIIFHAYVKPLIPVTNYRYEVSGIRPEHLRDAMPLKHVQRRIQDFLCNGEPMWKIRPKSGKAKILVGHGLDQNLDRLQVEYPSIMLRDTAKYPPLMKTSKLSNSLKYLAQAYLGYDIQTGIQDPYEDCVATMRLYMRMRSQVHKKEEYPLASDPPNRNNFASWRQNELQRMTPEGMLEISRLDYYCWCLDS